MQLVLKCFQACLFVLNLFYFAFGIGFLIAAIYLHLNPTRIDELVKVELGEQHGRLIQCLLALALLSLLVGLVGCASILAKKAWLLFVYFVCLFGIFGLQFAAAVYLQARRQDLFDLLSDRLVDVIGKYETSPLYKQAVDSIQTSFKCCGWRSPADWLNSTYLPTSPTSQLRPPAPLPPSFNTLDNTAVFTSPNSTLKLVLPSRKAFLLVYRVPQSCCDGLETNCALRNTFHEVGCEPFVRAYLNQVGGWVVWLLAFLNMFQFVLLILALYLLCIIFLDHKYKRNSTAAAAAVVAKSGNKYHAARPLLSSTDGVYTGPPQLLQQTPVPAISGQLVQPTTYYSYYPGGGPQYATTFAL